MATIRIKNLRLPTYIGFNPEELVNKQDVVINLEIEVDIPAEALEKDDPDGIFDYKVITKQIVALVDDGHFKLLEVLTQQIVNLVMEHGLVNRVQVEVDKPNALRFADSVSCQMEAKKMTV